MKFTLLCCERSQRESASHTNENRARSLAHSLTRALWRSQPAGLPAHYEWRSVPSHPSHFIQSKLHFILKIDILTHLFTCHRSFFLNRGQRLLRSKAGPHNSYEITDFIFVLSAGDEESQCYYSSSFYRRAFLPNRHPVTTKRMRAAVSSIIGYFSHYIPQCYLLWTSKRWMPARATD